MQKGTKIALAIGGLAVVGVGGFLLYKRMKKKQEEALGVTETGTGGGATGGGVGNTMPSGQSQTGGQPTQSRGGGFFSRIGNWFRGATSNIAETGGKFAEELKKNANVGCGGNYSGIGFPLKKGSCGWRVKALQGYLGTTADGKFGSGTEKLLKSRQNSVSKQPVGWSAGYGKVSEQDFKALPLFNKK